MKKSPKERTRCSECGNSTHSEHALCAYCEKHSTYRRELSGNAQFEVWQRYLRGSSMDGIMRWKDQGRRGKGGRI